MESIPANNMGDSSPTSGPIQHAEILLGKKTKKPLRSILKRLMPTDQPKKKGS
jgi:hypothetical protein